jgi:hypothetical protein
VPESPAASRPRRVFTKRRERNEGGGAEPTGRLQVDMTTKGVLRKRRARSALGRQTGKCKGRASAVLAREPHSRILARLCFHSLTDVSVSLSPALFWAREKERKAVLGLSLFRASYAPPDDLAQGRGPSRRVSATSSPARTDTTLFLHLPGCVRNVTLESAPRLPDPSAGLAQRGRGVCTTFTATWSC